MKKNLELKHTHEGRNLFKDRSSLLMVTLELDPAQSLDPEVSDPAESGSEGYFQSQNPHNEGLRGLRHC